MRRVSVAWMLLYSVARAGVGVHDTFFNAAAGLFLASYGLPNVVIGFLANERSFVGGVLNPIAGSVSDRLRWRFGRRKPFMLCIIPVVLGFLILMNRPDTWLTVTIFLIGPIFLGVAVTAYEVLLPDNVVSAQRGLVNGVNRACAFLAGMGLLLLSSALWEDAPWGIFLAVAVGLGLGFLITFLTVQEGPTPEGEDGGSLKFRPLDYLRDLLAMREATKYVVSYLFFWMGIGGVTPFITRFGHEDLGIPENETFLLLLAVFVSTLVAVVPAGWLGDKLGKMRVSVWGLLVFGLIIIASSQIATKEQAVVALAVAGLAQAIPTALAYPLFTEIVPARRMGELSGLSTMIWSMGQPLGATMLGLMADATGTLRTVLLGGGLLLLVSWLLLRSVRVEERAVSAQDS